MRRRQILSAGEQDAYTSWRHRLCYLQQPGAIAKIKRITHKRERREGRAETRQEW